MERSPFDTPAEHAALAPFRQGVAKNLTGLAAPWFLPAGRDRSLSVTMTISRVAGDNRICKYQMSVGYPKSLCKVQVRGRTASGLHRMKGHTWRAGVPPCDDVAWDVPYAR
jgi:hypothetical protein